MAKLKPLTYEYVYNYFKEQGCELLSKEYKNNHTLLDYKCSCGNISKINFLNFSEGHRSKSCMKGRCSNKKQELTYEFVYGFFKYLGLQLLSNEYIDNKQKLIFICSCGKQDKITFNALQRGMRCKACNNGNSARNKPFCIEYVRYFLESLGMKLLSEEYFGENKSIKYICKCGNINTTQFSCIRLGHTCRKCAAAGNSKENCNLWEGGLTSLSQYLRGNTIIDWKKESITASNYKCVITGDSFDDIHHLYSLNKIIKDTLDILNIPMKYTYHNVSNYTIEELKYFEEVFMTEHNKYPLGVCLSRPIHNLFHSLYNYDNTPEQFEEFKIRYRLGEFKNIMK